MKKYILFTLIVIGMGCRQQPQEAPTLANYNQQLAEKKKQLIELETEISELTDKIAQLDPSLQEKAKLVDTSKMVAQDFTRYINLQGAIEAEDPVNAVSEIAGRILTLNFKEGDPVRKDQVVATLDVESIQKQVDEINTSLDLARDVFERQKRLWDQNIGSEVQYLQAKNNVERLEKSLESLDFQMSKSVVHAPISGTVDMVLTKQGEVVSPGLPIIQILNTSQLKVTTDLPENYLKIVRRGQIVNLEFPSLDLSTQGRISLLGSKIDPANRTLELEIALLTRHRLFKPNLLAEIKIEELSADDVITMPLEYILQEVDGTEFVYVVDKDDAEKYRARKRYVNLGEAADGNVIIDDGLLVGETVVFKGARNVSDGELVEFSNL